MVDAKIECEEILKFLMPFAEQMLAKHGEFVPFGATMAPDGTISASAVSTEDERRPAAEVMDLLKGGFRAGASSGKYKACGLAYDILATPPGKEAKQDAIAVELDHRDGYSIAVAFPYSISSSNEVAVEPPFAVEGDGSVFPR